MQRYLYEPGFLYEEDVEIELSEIYDPEECPQSTDVAIRGFNVFDAKVGRADRAAIAFYRARAQAEKIVEALNNG